MDRFTLLSISPAMLAMMDLLLWMMTTGRRVTRRKGVVLLVAYGAYLTALVVIAAGRVS